MSRISLELTPVNHAVYLGSRLLQQWLHFLCWFLHGYQLP